MLCSFCCFALVKCTLGDIGCVFRCCPHACAHTFLDARESTSTASVFSRCTLEVRYCFFLADQVHWSFSLLFTFGLCRPSAVLCEADVHALWSFVIPAVHSVVAWFLAYIAPFGLFALSILLSAFVFPNLPSAPCHMLCGLRGVP